MGVGLLHAASVPNIKSRAHVSATYIQIEDGAVLASALLLLAFLKLRSTYFLGFKLLLGHGVGCFMVRGSCKAQTSKNIFQKMTF